MKRPFVRLLLVLAVAAAAILYWLRRPAGEGGLVLAGSIEARLVEVGSLVGGRVSEVRVDEGTAE